MRKEPVEKKRIHCEWCGGKLKRDLRGSTCSPSCSDSLMRHKQIMKDKETMDCIEVVAMPRKRKPKKILVTEKEQTKINKEARRRWDEVDVKLTFGQGIQLYRHRQAAWLLG